MALPAARADYLAPWWAAWLHRFPHVSLRLQPVPGAFRPQQPDYQQSLLFLGLVAAVCLGLNLLFLTIYLICLCGCKRGEESETKRPNSCCVTWTAVVAGLVCCAAVGIGFYGNSETNDGVYQLIYAIDNANHTLSGIDTLVSGTTVQMKVGLEQHLARLNEIFAMRGDYVQTLKFLQQMAGNIVRQLSGLPVWQHVSVDLTAVAGQVGYVEYYRWLSYLLLFILDLIICLIACLGLAKRSRCLLTMMLCCGLVTLILSWASLAVDTSAAVGTSDFCVAPDKFIMNLTRGDLRAEVVHYYLYCSQNLSNPFQQALTIYQRSLTTMQIQIQGLLQFAVPLFPTAECLCLAPPLSAAERPARNPAAAELLRDQPAPADGHAGLPGPAQGLPGWADGHLLRWGGGLALSGVVLPAGRHVLLHAHLCHAAGLEALRRQGSGLRRH
nr:protein tweety homolog 2 isoform X3 [Caretta caretta]